MNEAVNFIWVTKLQVSLFKNILHRFMCWDIDSEGSSSDWRLPLICLKGPLFLKFQRVVDVGIICPDFLVGSCYFVTVYMDTSVHKSVPCERHFNKVKYENCALDQSIQHWNVPQLFQRLKLLKCIFYIYLSPKVEFCWWIQKWLSEKYVSFCGSILDFWQHRKLQEQYYSGSLK